MERALAMADYVMLGLILGGIALVPLIVLEAVIYRYAMPLQWRQAFITSFCANAVSFYAAYAVFMFLDYMSGLPQEPYFGTAPSNWVKILTTVAIVVELPIVRLVNRRFPRPIRLLWIAFAINLVTQLVVSDFGVAAFARA